MRRELRRSLAPSRIFRYRQKHGADRRCGDRRQGTQFLNIFNHLELGHALMLTRTSVYPTSNEALTCVYARSLSSLRAPLFIVRFGWHRRPLTDRRVPAETGGGRLI